MSRAVNGIQLSLDNCSYNIYIYIYIYINLNRFAAIQKDYNFFTKMYSIHFL